VAKECPGGSAVRRSESLSTTSSPESASAAAVGQSRLRKRLYAWHGWIGLNLGLLLFAVCFSGAIAVFTPELDWALDPARRAQPNGASDSQKASWGQLERAAKEAHPEAAIRFLARGATPRRADMALVHYGGGDLRTLLIDPYAARVTGQRAFLDLKSFVRIFHKQFYLVPGTVGFHGTLIVGLLSFALLAAVITGMVAFKGWWKALLTLRTGKSRRIFWSDLHRCLGGWALLVALVASLTGLWYLGERLADDVGLVDHEPAFPRLNPDTLMERGPVLKPLPIDELMDRARSAYPELKPTAVALPARLEDTFVVTGSAEAFAIRDRANQIALDPYSGEVIAIRRGSEIPALKRLAHTIDPLHFGTFGGAPTRWIWFLAGIALSVGILVGAYTHALRSTRTAEGGDRAPSMRWALSGLATSIVLCASAVSGAAYIAKAQIGLDIEPRASSPVARFSVGEAKGVLYLDGLPANGRQSASLRFIDGSGYPYVRNAEFRHERAAGRPEASAKFSEGRLHASLPLGDQGEIHIEALRLRLQPEAKWIEANPLPQGNGRPAAIQPPPRPEVPSYVFVGIGVFSLLLLAPTAIWLRRLRW